jgi:hypothetical protein
VIEQGEEHLAGVTSRGDSACSEYGVSIRVDTHRDWLDGRIAALDSPRCTLDTWCATSCGEPDPDCSTEFPPHAGGSGGCTVAGSGGRGTAGALAFAVVLLLFVRGPPRGMPLVVGITVAAVSALGCAGAEQPGPRAFCVTRPLGDPREMVRLVIVAMDAGGEIEDAADGAPVVPLANGGRGLRLSVRARNLDGCAVAISVRLATAEDAQLRASDGTFVELIGDGDGWGAPLPSADLSFVDLPAEVGVDYLVTILAEDAHEHWGGVTEVIRAR